MTTAFQSNAFQNNDFQIDAEVIPSGGGPEYWGGVQRRGKTLKEEQEEWALRLGLNPEVVEVIQAIAVEQVRNPLDEQQRFEQLSRELEVREIEWDAKYLEILNTERVKYLDAEIKRLLKLKYDEEEAMLLILIAAHLT